jgi:hypothetical protein
MGQSFLEMSGLCNHKRYQRQSLRVNHAFEVGAGAAPLGGPSCEGKKKIELPSPSGSYIIHIG